MENAAVSLVLFKGLRLVVVARLASEIVVFSVQDQITTVCLVMVRFLGVGANTLPLSNTQMILY